jgi:glycosyltransferase involved in cell wall biosynthesis
MRVVVAVGSLQIGGAETQAVRLAVELQARGHAVEVLALMSGGPLEDVLTQAGVPHRVLEIQTLLGRSPTGRISTRATARNLGRLVALARSLRRAEVDVVHAFMLWPSALCLAAARLAGVPVRVSGRRNLTTTPARRDRLVERAVARLATSITANSEAVARTARASVLPQAVITVIHNGIDLLPRAEQVACQPPEALVVANLIGYKGHRHLVDALARSSQPTVVHCLGEGAERAALEEQAESHGLAGHVHFHGQVTDVSRWHQRTQLVILPSTEEGFPNAVLEAMSAGLPVIATDVGGVPEIIEHGRTGLLVPAREPEALAAAIDQLASDPGLRERLGSAARTSVSERFSWDRSTTAHEALYQADLQRLARPAPR